MFRCSRKFSAGTTQKVVFHLLFNRVFCKLFVNGKQPLILFTGHSPSLEGLKRNSVASTKLVKILPTAKMARELNARRHNLRKRFEGLSWEKECLFRSNLVS